MVSANAIHIALVIFTTIFGFCSSHDVVQDAMNALDSQDFYRARVLLEELFDSPMPQYDLVARFAFMNSGGFPLDDRYAVGSVLLERFGNIEPSLWLPYGHLQMKMGDREGALRSMRTGALMKNGDALWSLYREDRQQGLATTSLLRLSDGDVDASLLDVYSVIMLREGWTKAATEELLPFTMQLNGDVVMMMAHSYFKSSRFMVDPPYTAADYFPAAYYSVLSLRRPRLSSRILSVETTLSAALRLQPFPTRESFFSYLASAKSENGELAQIVDATLADVLRSADAVFAQNRTLTYEPGVVFFCPPVLPQKIGPSSLDEGVPGSQEAVIYLARALSEAGVSVTVYSDSVEADRGTDSYAVTWRDVYAFDPFVRRDVVVCWYSQDYSSLTLGAHVRILWLHNPPSPSRVVPALAHALTHVLVLCEEELVGLPGYLRDKCVITRNAVASEHHLDGPNHPHRFIYASSPDRGLDLVLDRWPHIHRAIPAAELHVYYGFSSTFVRIYGEHVRDHFLQKLKQPGVIYHGMVPQAQLARAFAESGFWLYPTHFNESSCMTSMKAQANGAIPITSKYRPVCLLSDRNATFDLGPPPSAGLINSDKQWADSWTRAVIAAFDEDTNRRLDDHRRRMKSWARGVLTWANVASQWTSWILPPSVFR